MFGVTEDAMGVTNRRFTRREFLLYEAVMDGNREVGEATAVVERYNGWEGQCDSCWTPRLGVGAARGVAGPPGR